MLKLDRFSCSQKIQPKWDPPVNSVVPQQTPDTHPKCCTHDKNDASEQGVPGPQAP